MVWFHPLTAAPPTHTYHLTLQCYTPEEMVEAIRKLGDRFQFRLLKPLRSP